MCVDYSWLSFVLSKILLSFSSEPTAASTPSMRAGESSSVVAPEVIILRSCTIAIALYKPSLEIVYQTFRMESSAATGLQSEGVLDPHLRRTLARLVTLHY